MTQTCALSSCARTTREPRGSVRRCFPSGTGSDHGPPDQTFSGGRPIGACPKARHRICHTSYFKIGFRSAGSASADTADCALRRLQKHIQYYICLPNLLPPSWPFAPTRYYGALLEFPCRPRAGNIPSVQILVSSADPLCSPTVRALRMPRKLLFIAFRFSLSINRSADRPPPRRGDGESA